ncbi:MAG: hypothetical protein II970_07315 [Paludibacteraceae bacterium]|jgi:hypothetical protein|nr:hypothetical protein [Paludibacteraceae bacterium]
MKKTIALLMLSVITLGVMAQSPVYRVGDKYMMDGKMMNKREFRGYLQNTSPEAFRLFNNGYKLSIAGWSCFGVGLAFNSVGSAMLRRYIRDNAQKDAMYDVGYTLSSAGAGLTVAGVTCLAVGYTRMHKAVHLYNIEKANRPDLRWVFGVNSNGGMSVAMQF